MRRALIALALFAALQYPLLQKYAAPEPAKD